MMNRRDLLTALPAALTLFAAARVLAQGDTAPAGVFLISSSPALSSTRPMMSA